MPGGSGHCRQFLCELPSVDNMVFLSGRDPSIFNTMDVLLPHAFKPDRLLDTAAGDGAQAEGQRTLFGDLQPEVKTLPWPRLGAHVALIRGCVAAQEEVSDEALLAALSPRSQPPSSPGPSDELLLSAARACRRSHAVYSGCDAGVGLELTSGAVVWGAAIENTAYNPTLPPLQCALISALNAAPIGSGAVELGGMLRRAVLVESLSGAAAEGAAGGGVATSWEGRTRQVRGSPCPCPAPASD